MGIKITAILIILVVWTGNMQSQTEVPVKYDAMIRGGEYAGENYGAIEEMLVKASPTSESYSRRILLQFDAGSTGIGSIRSAVLKLYCTYVYADFEVSAFGIPDGWNESDLNWENAPVAGERLNTKSLTEASVGTYVEFEVSGYVYNELQGDGIVSILLDDPSFANAHVKFFSKEAPSEPPVLVLEEGTPETPETPGGFEVTGISATRAILQWDDLSSSESGFRIYRRTGEGTFQVVGTAKADTNRYIDWGLEPHTTYVYEVTAFNSFGESEPTNEIFITTTGYSGTAYYVDQAEGADANTGTSPENAWNSLEKLSSEVFEPGDTILFHAGQSWTGELILQGSGIDTLPIMMDRYGEGPDPHLQGPGTYMSSTIFMHNLQYWEISNLKITNPEPDGAANHYKRGIYILGEDAGELSHLHFRNMEITDIEVPMQDFAESRYYGGIYFEVVGNTIPTWFNNILFEGCYFHHLDRTGLSNQSTWWRRGLHSSFGELISDPGQPVTYDNWVPSLNIVVRNCRFEHIGGNGLIMRVSRNTLVEQNEFYYCAEDISGNAAFCFNTDSCIFQYNEASYTVYNEGDTDARGIDSDFRTKYTIIQYNYLHHNGKGGVVATGGAGGLTTVPRFNDSTVIRYNVIANNQQHIIRASGKLTNMMVYNNVIFSDETINDISITEYGNWSGASPRNIYYWNNIFYVLGEGLTFSFDNVFNVNFSHNCYYGIEPEELPEDHASVVADPRFVVPEVAEDFQQLDNYRLRSASPCLGSGREIQGSPESDLFAEPVTSPLNMGVYQGTGVTTGDQDHYPVHDNQRVRVFPTLITQVLHVEFQNLDNETIYWEIINPAGKKVFSDRFRVEGRAGNFPIMVGDHLKQPGCHFIRFYLDSGETFTHRFIII